VSVRLDPSGSPGVPDSGACQKSAADPLIYKRAVSEIVRLRREARARDDYAADSAVLATATSEARPSVRTVWIVRIAHSGFSFFADVESGKGRQLRANPWAAICFHWQTVRHQVNVEGTTRLLEESEADLLWSNVPRDYALAHWASEQNRETESVSALYEATSDFRRRFGAQRVPRAPRWRAFELSPSRIDIWQAGWGRLRPHLHFVKHDGTWKVSRRNP